MTGKDIFNSIFFCLLPAELPAPRNAGTGVCPGTRVPVFGIPGCLLIGRVVPVMPPFRQNVAAKLAPYENRCGIRAPRPAKVNTLNTVSSREPATVEYIPELMVLNRGGGSNI